ncbi:MAG: flagellar motor protein MotB [Candidatus Binatia bacterium]|nr:flagellar motor protein MotB [Candidatus Binatia bacterium]
MSLHSADRWVLGEEHTTTRRLTSSARQRALKASVTRRGHPSGRLVCSFVLATLVHAGIVRLPLPVFPPPPPQPTMIELVPDALSSPVDTQSALTNEDLQQLRTFHDAVVGRAAALEQTLAAALERQAAVEVARQQHLATLEAERTALQSHVIDLQQHMTELTAAQAELAAQLAAERERAAALERQLQEQTRAKEAELSSLRGAYDRLVASLQGEIAQKEIALHQVKEKLVVTILDRVLFPSGQATLTPEGRQIMQKVGAILAKVTDRRILIEGHTDNVPIGPTLSQQYPTNWELSTARATEVVKYLITEAQLPPHRLSAVGRADTAPVASNESEEGRKQNRRIEIILLPPDDLLHGSVGSS